MVKKKTTGVPAAADDLWQNHLKSACLKVGFDLNLSRSMIEFLCAVSEDVTWDVRRYGSVSRNQQVNAAAAAALYNRGLIVHRTKARPDDWFDWYESVATHHTDGKLWFTHWTLSPAGQLVVDLLKLAGAYVLSDTAAAKRGASSRRRTAGR